MIEYFGKNNDQESTAAVLEREGINVCFSKEEAEEAIKNGDRMMLCQPYNKEKEPTNYDAGGKMPEGHILLQEMLELGLKRLGDKKPFFIMCEGGEIDWAAHSQKTFPTVLSIVEFDKAISVAYEFYKAHPEETLIVVTADHETGGLGLVSGNADFNLSEQGVEYRWCTSGHSAQMVPVYLYGAGAALINGIMENSELGAMLKSFLEK